METALQLTKVNRSVLIALIAALVGAGAGIGGYALADDNGSSAAPQVSVVSAGPAVHGQPQLMSGRRP